MAETPPAGSPAQGHVASTIEKATAAASAAARRGGAALVLAVAIHAVMDPGGEPCTK